MSYTHRRSLILETYPSQESSYDGLSGLFDEVKSVGTVVADTRNMARQKVLVCGVAPLYENKISPQNTNVIFTTFESDKIPDEWVYSINSYTHCVVPHAEVKKVFEASGVRIPVSVVHNGYKRYERNKISDSDTAQFNVGFLGIPVSRKNLLKLYSACRQLKETSIPELKLHVHVATFYDWLDAMPFEQMKADLTVQWTTGKYTSNEIAAWYYRLSCYIFPSSGEGWSYTPRESMYLGIPTIISGIPVHDELIESGYYKVIKSSGKEPANFDGITHGKWDIIDVDQIRDAIMDVYLRRQHFRALALAGSGWIEKKWRNEDISKTLSALLDKM